MNKISTLSTIKTNSATFKSCIWNSKTVIIRKQIISDGYELYVDEVTRILRNFDDPNDRLTSFLLYAIFIFYFSLTVIHGVKETI